MENEYPAAWKPDMVHVRSGWKNNPKVLSEIVTALNEEMFVEDESEKMEEIDLILEHLKSKYIIKLKP